MKSNFSWVSLCTMVSFITMGAFSSFGQQDSPTLSCNPFTAGLGSDGTATISIDDFGVETETFSDCATFNFDITFSDLPGSAYTIVNSGAGSVESVIFNCEALGGENDFTVSTDCIDLLGSNDDITDVCSNAFELEDFISPLICVEDVTIECDVDNGGNPLPIAAWSGMISSADYPAGNFSYPITSADDFVGMNNSIPVIDVCPPSVSVETGMGYTGVPYIEENDVCGGFTVSYTDVYSTEYSAFAHDCPNHSYSIERTWTVTDASGNTNTAVQVITVEDTQDPEFVVSSLPAELVVMECGSFDAGAPAAVTATDNCYLASVNLVFDNTDNPEPASGDIAEGDCLVAQALRIWEATDACGRVSTFSQKFEIIDTTAPELQDLSAEDISLNSNCTGEFAYSIIATDVCDSDLDYDWNILDGGGNTVAAGTGSEVSADLIKGEGYTLTVWVNDACGNVSTDNVSFDVIDDSAPELVCHTDFTVNSSEETSADYAGTCVVAPSTVRNSIRLEIVPFNPGNPAQEGEIADNCQIVSLVRSIVRADGSTASDEITNPNRFEEGDFISIPDLPNWNFLKGDNVITYVITDCGGNQAECSITVTVVDDESAVLECPEFPVTINTSFDGTGDCEVCSVGLITDFSGDFAPENWTTSVVGFPGGDGTAVFNGSESLTMTSSNNGIEDGPSSDVFTCITIQNSGILSFNWDYTSFDVDSSYWDPYGYSIDGDLTILTLDNQFEQSGTASVPVIAGQEFCFYQGAADAALGSAISISSLEMMTVPMASLMPIFSDNCPNPVISSDLEECYGPGMHSITWTVEDCGGNITTCTVDFEVIDDEAPIVVCPSIDPVSNDAGMCSAVITDITPGVSDNCDGTVINYTLSGATVTSGVADGDFSALQNLTFNVGVTQVQYVAEDAQGNLSAPCTFEVTVNDTELPVVNNCPDAAIEINTSADGLGNCMTAVEGLILDVTDNCCVSGMSYTLTSEDGVEGPFIVDLAAGVSATELDLSSITFYKGTTTVDLLVWDCHMLEGTCSFDVIVSDDEAPAFGDCPSDINVETVDTDCNQLVAWLSPSLDNASDNCPLNAATLEGPWVSIDSDEDDQDIDTGVNVVNADPLSSAVFPVGVRYIKYLLTDDSGNETWCIFSITVNDDVAPTAICPGDINLNVDLSCNPIFVLSDYTTLPAFEDNCGIESITQVPAAGTVYDGIGTNPALLSDGDVIAVTVTAASNGETISCTFNVTVEDNSGPNIACPADQEVLTSEATTSGACQFTLPDFTDMATANNSCGNEDPTVTQSPAPGTAYSAGSTVTVTLTATDDAANETQCSFDVTFIDDSAPVLTDCGNDPATVTAAVGECSALVQLNAPSYTDCDASTTVTATVNGQAITPELANFYRFDVCNTEVVWLAEDGNGNSTELCSNTVTVVEAIDPINQPFAACAGGPGGITLALNENGVTVLTAMAYGNGSADNCSADLDYAIYLTDLGAGTAASQIVFDCDNIGINSVTLIVTDCSGNQGSCSSFVTVQDIVNPLIFAPEDITIECNVSNDGTPDTGDSNATNTPISSSEINNLDIELGQDAENGITGYAQSWDNCSGIVTYADVSTQGTDPADCSYYNYSVVRTWSIEDESGNVGVADVQTITVEDSTKPSVEFSPVDVFLNCDDPNYDSKFADAMAEEALFSDLCASNYLSIVLESEENELACSLVDSQAGVFKSTTKTWTATDPCGNATEVVQVIYTFDETAPTLACPTGNQTVYYTGASDDDCSVYVPLVANADDCQSEEGDLTFTYQIKNAVNQAPLTAVMAGNDASGEFTSGNYCIEFTVVDPCGNESTCLHFFSVEDDTLPVIDCSNLVDINAEVSTGTCSLSNLLIQGPSMTDNCDGGYILAEISGAYADSEIGVITTFSVDGNSSLLTPLDFPLGESVITYTAYDASGNESANSCSQTVTVTDNVAPSYDCSLLEDLVIESSEDGYYSGYTCDAPVNWKSPMLDENCTIAIYTVTIETPDGASTSEDTFNDESNNFNFPMGTSTVTYYAEDGSGNSWTCDFTVTVTDNEEPTMICQDITVELDENGLASIVPADVDNGSFDNCIVELAIDVNAFDCSDLGVNTVILTGTDLAENSYTCISKVTVVDLIDPVLTCEDHSVNTSADGMGDCGYTASNGEFDPAVSDNTDPACPLTLVNDYNGTNTLDGETFEACESLTVTWTATDEAGNEVTCESVITVTDDEAPMSIDRAGINCGEVRTKIALLGDCSSNMSWMDFRAEDFADNCEECGALLVEGPFAGNDVECDGEPGGLRTANFPIGDTEVMYLVTDPAGNTTECSFTVTVIDNQQPTIQVPLTDEVLMIDLCGSPVWPTLDPIAVSDNCPGVEVTQMPTPGSPMLYEDGDMVSVTLIAVDAVGNATAASYNVIITNTCSGCLDETACNYNSTAVVSDGSCVYATEACDYCSTSPEDGSGTVIDGDTNDNGLCDADEQAGCTDASACNYDALATFDDSSCDFIACAGCTNVTACNYDADATIENSTCEFTSCEGCTDVNACNYDATATIENNTLCDYSCIGCTDADACNYTGATVEDGSCEYDCLGCTDASACNYDASASQDDGSCEFTSCAGCTDAAACNYDADATIDDLSCEYVSGDCEVCQDGVVISTDYNCDGICGDVLGCTYDLACNFNAGANVDDGSCEYVSCQVDCNDPEASNYYVFALGNTECEFIDFDALEVLCPADINRDGMITATDLTLLLASFGVECE